MIVKAKRSNKKYALSKKQVCPKCMGERVVYVPNIKKYRNDIRDCGYWEPCTCIKKKLGL